MNSKVIHYLLVRLSILYPIIAILGNILPPLGTVKINIIFNAFLVFLSVCILFLKRKAVLLMSLFLILLFNFFLHKSIELKNIFTLFSSLLILLALSQELSVSKKLIRLFLLFSSIPLFISILQIFHVFPISFGYFNYVNETNWGNERIIRPNGYLYTAYELSVVTVLFLISLTFFTEKTKQRIFVIGLGLVSIYLFRLRAALVCWGILSFIEFRSVDSPKISRFIKPIAMVIVLLIIANNLDLIKELFQVSKLSSEANYGQFLTGRINIWITLINEYVNGNIVKKLFGFGFDYSQLFQNSVFWKSEYLPGTHNTFLEIIITTGIFGILLTYHMFSSFFSVIHQYAIVYKKVFLVIIILLGTLGMTGPILKNPFWGIGIYFITAILTTKLKSAET